VKVKVIVVVMDVLVLRLKFSEGTFYDEVWCLALCDLGRRVDENWWTLLFLLSLIVRVVKILWYGREIMAIDVVVVHTGWKCDESIRETILSAIKIRGSFTAGESWWKHNYRKKNQKVWWLHKLMRERILMRSIHWW
jgi:hypothetical protein